MPSLQGRRHKEQKVKEKRFFLSGDGRDESALLFSEKHIDRNCRKFYNYEKCKRLHFEHKEEEMKSWQCM